MYKRQEAGQRDLDDRKAALLRTVHEDMPPLMEEGCQQAAGVLVDAVHDAGADLAADAGQAALAMPQQGVDQGAVRVAGGLSLIHI